MSNDEVKNFLLKVWKLNRKCEEDFERIQIIRAQLTKVTTSYSSVHIAGGNNDKMGDLIAALTIKEAEYQDHVLAYLMAINEVKNKIDTLENQAQRRVLKMRYLDFYKWDDIAVKMDYDVRHVTRLHGNALKLLASN